MIQTVIDITIPPPPSPTRAVFAEAVARLETDPAFVRAKERLADLGRGMQAVGREIGPLPAVTLDEGIRRIAAEIGGVPPANTPLVPGLT